jgi:hypothetical protein
VELNGDGILDVITGEYAPGNILFFAGTKDGFRAPIVIAEKDVIDSVQNTDFTMAAACALDWDGDGDQDLVVGSTSGKVLLNLNEGTKTEFHFGKRVPLVAGGAPMKVKQKSHPIAVDWDGDGVLDLLVGDECTGVTFFRGHPDRTFEPGVSVFSGRKIPLDQPFDQVLDRWHAESKLPGYRVRLTTNDWNEDGKLDLLVGNCEEVDGTTQGNVYVFLRR